MKKLLLLASLFSCLLSVAQEKDTIVTVSKTIYCKIYAIDDGKLRYNEKGVGKIISCSSIVSCSLPWKHMVDSINHKGDSHPNIIDITKISDSIKYCEIVGIGTFKNVYVTIDFGQKVRTTFFGLAKVSDFIMGKNGKFKSFNSMIDALNFMVQNGWDFVTCYIVTEPGFGTSENVYHYLLKRR